MNCPKEIYNKGSYWFKRLVDRYSKYGIYFEPYKKYNFVKVYYKTPMYKLHLLSVPIYMKELNYLDTISSNRLENQSFYNEMREKGKVKNAKEQKDIVLGYWGTIYKIDKRFYMLRNNQEFLSTVTTMAKNTALST